MIGVSPKFNFVELKVPFDTQDLQAGPLVQEADK
jgi:hypothetical protein